MNLRAGRSGEAGFTLIELLVVLVILPLIIGAAADAIIVTVRTDAATSGRISDSANAQLSAAYFARDVQGALELTTDASLAPGFVANGTNPPKPAPFASTAPEICGPATVLSATSVPAGLVVALYRPASTAAAPATDVGYWLEGTGSGTQLIRYSCSLTAGYAATNPVSVTLADNAQNPNAPGAPISPTALSVDQSILPAQIGTAAALGWTDTQALTVYQGATTTLGGASYSLTAAVSEAFAPGWITVRTSVGPVPVDCSAVQVTATATTFQGCTGGSGVVSLGDSITQSAVTGVEATVTEPTSSYHFVLLGAPYASSNGVGKQGSGATLLILGSGGINLIGTGSYTCPINGNKDKLCVAGSIVMDGGTASCNGTSGIGVSGSIGSVSPPSSSTCDPGQIVSSPVVADPVSQHLAVQCLTSAQSGPISNLPTNPHPDLSGDLVPGIYTAPISNATLEPGVYVLEGGIANGGVTIAAPSAADPWYQNPPASGAANYDPSAGVLLYLPGATGTDPAGCISAPSAPAATLKDPPSTAISVAPLDSAQASYWLDNPYLGDTWIWQDVTNTQAFSLAGNVSVKSNGLAYLPGATLVTSSGSPSITTGRMIVGGVQLSGTPSITLNGS